MENSANIATSLSRMAQLQPDTAAVIMAGTRGPGRRISYRELDNASDRIACGLREVGIGAGTRTVLMVRPSHDFFTLAFALFKIGAVLVAVDPGLGFRNLGQCLKEAKPLAFIGIPQGRPSYLVFNFSSSSFLGGSRGSISYDTLLRPRAGYTYDASARYADGIYYVVIRESGARGSAGREIERTGLNECGAS